MVLHVHHGFVTLATNREVGHERLVQFYADLFGQPPALHHPDRYAEFHLPGLRLGIFKPSDRHQAEFSSRAASPLSLCLEVNDLEEAISHCTALGYPPPGPITVASHGREIYVYDPLGNRLILHESSPNAPPQGSQSTEY